MAAVPGQNLYSITKLAFQLLLRVVRGWAKLEKINKRSLRFVTRDKSTTYETLLKQLNLLSPLNQRIVKMATGVYKAIHGYRVPRGIGELL